MVPESDMSLRTYVQTFPDEPGIYLFWNEQKDIVYVGKATSLKHRVASYFRDKKTSRPIEQLMHHVASITYKQTDSVLEAIILEANTIKQLQPPYNVIGKDNKSWNYITISQDAYPVCATIRQHDLAQLSEEQKKKQYAYIFGPYPGLKAKEALTVLGKLFSLSTCQIKKKQQTKKPCLYYQMHQCLGVCTGEISTITYKKKVITPLVWFLQGKKQKMLDILSKQMMIASKKQQFEEATRIRNQLQSLQKIQDLSLINKSFVEDEWFTNEDAVFQYARIEGYDISHMSGTNIVGSMVVWQYGAKQSSLYRTFRIKSLTDQSDVDALDEVLTRRFTHPEWGYPSIVLVDGGLPQVNRIAKVLMQHQPMLSVHLVGIAKGKERKRNDFFFPKHTDKAFIAYVSRHKQLFIEIRDEAHRFANAFRKKQHIV